MPCPSVPLTSVSYITLVAVALCSADERCLSGPLGPGDVDYLDACRPAPVSAAHREAVLYALPAKGAVTTFGLEERDKLNALASVLRVHGREGVYTVQVIDVPQAWTGLHARAVLLISLPALRLLGAEELQALVAHEIGHEYWWDAWEAARGDADHARLRSLEGLCDAVAALTLVVVGTPPERLISALTAVHHFNRRRFGTAANEASYPSLQERRKAVMRFRGAHLEVVPHVGRAQRESSSNLRSTRPVIPGARF